MKKIYLILAAAVGMTITSCTSSDYLGDMDPNAQTAINDGAIHFGTAAKGMTRANFEGAEAADKLGNMFVVSGYKGTYTEWGKSSTTSTIVFDNYLVNWTENTANTTESNSSNWEYVGVAPIKHAAENGIIQQTIKYWDYSVGQYDFIAWSTGKNTVVYEESSLPGSGETGANNTVYVSKIIPSSATTAAYTFKGTAEALSQCYISDLVTVKKDAAGTYGEVSGYNKPVTLKFRQLGSKVRIAIYETVPGYSVKNVQFYTAANVNLDDATKNNAHLFTTVANNIYKGGEYTVKFSTIDSPSNADNNQAHIDFSGTDYTQDTKVNYGIMNYTIREKGETATGAVYLGRTSNTASFAGDASKNYYDFFLPNEKGTNLNLRVNYTLEAIDGSGETIVVKGATAQVPSIYTTWKPGYAYTYLFKISDKTNGYTGVYDPTKPDDTTVNSDPAGLYPITFDALVVNAEDNDGGTTQETITLVSTPSITTYQNGSNVVNNNEYTVLTPSGKITGEIYVTVNDGGGFVAVSPTPSSGVSVSSYYKYVDGKYTKCGGSEKSDGTTTYYELKPILANSDLVDLTDKVALYTVAEGTTEAEVIDAMQMQDDDLGGATIKGRNKVSLTEAKTTGESPTNLLTVTDEVTYGVDGNKINVATGKAAKFVPAANTTYAFVYTKTAATPANDDVKYSPIAFNDATVTTKYRYVLEDIATAGDVQKDVVYFAPVSSVLTKKSVFIGQGVSNLYTRSGDVEPYTYTAATNYAVTNTKYYYTLDGGSTYTEAHEIAYANFNATGTDQLYVKSGAYYVAKTETAPVDGTAYYHRTGSGTGSDPYVYTYCVIYPEQTTTEWKTLNTSTYVTVGSESEIVGMTYFDKYIVNDGVYYVKVIKVQ